MIQWSDHQKSHRKVSGSIEAYATLPTIEAMNGGSDLGLRFRQLAILLGSRVSMVSGGKTINGSRSCLRREKERERMKKKEKERKRERLRGSLERAS